MATAEELAALADQAFDDAETAVAALEAALADGPWEDGSAPAEGRGRLRARLLLRLGESRETQGGDRPEALERALEAYRAAIRVLTRDEDPVLWAQLQHNLGRVYYARTAGERADNQERAIAANEAALTVRTREAAPTDWAKTQNNLANVYWYRVAGDRADNLERAIGLYEAAAQVRTREAFPADWAATQHNLANAYSDRLRGERADNIERAIGHCEAALTVRTREAFPADWALTQYTLANTCRYRLRGERADNFERAIALTETVLDVWTREDFPEFWAMAHNVLANAYAERIRGERADNLERAIAFNEAALQVYTREDFPEDWARTQNNLALTYSDRVRGTRLDNLERAIAFHEAVLEVYTREALPEEWALVQGNLGHAYSRRIRGGRADNLDRAIAHFEAALQVRTREAFPVDWAGTQHNLANAYRDRLSGDRAGNIERAVGLFEAVLQVLTREASPVDWARTHSNLALAYLALASLALASLDRLRGERAGNLERAIGLLEAALTVHTREVLPRDHLDSCRHLGRALLHRGDWPRASEALAEARTTFRLLIGEGLDPAEARGLIEAAGPLFAQAAYAAAECGEAEQAFALACEGKARLLATALRLQRLDLPQAPRERLAGLRAAVREQSRLMDTLSGPERGEALDRLIGLRRELAGLIARDAALHEPHDTMAQARRLCTDGSIVVAPVVTEVGGKVFLVAAAPDGAAPALAVLDLPGLTSERMTALLQGDSAGAGQGWLAAFRPASAPEHRRLATQAVDGIGRELWSLLAGPLERRLGELGVAPDAGLVVLPSGGLGLLPLGLAQDPSTGRRLIDARVIVTAPSLEALDARAGPPGAPSLAAVVDPTGDLLHASAEGSLVAAHFEARALLDAGSASPAAVFAALRGRSHWHFATHGRFDPEDARRSALAMAAGRHLSVGDLLDAEDLGRPRLVVLSACETGLHDLGQAPEEFIGFPGAFMSLGARAVLGTLWPVDDGAAALLTARFYDGHLDEGLLPGPALRQAQLWLREGTQEGLCAYARGAAAQGRIGSGALAQLEAAIRGAAQAAVRFFDMAGSDRPDAAPPAEAEGPLRPYAHPVHWGGFVMTGR